MIQFSHLKNKLEVEIFPLGCIMNRVGIHLLPGFFS